MEKITFTKNAELVETYWFYDEAIKKGEYKTRVLEKASAFIMHERYCFFEEDLTFGDIFRYMEKHLDFFEIYLGNWCAEFVKEGLLPPNKSIVDSELLFLELYWDMRKTIMKGEVELHLPGKMELHAKGKPYEAIPGEPDGNKLDNYSVSFQKANNLAQYPIKINPSLILHTTDYDNKSSNPDSSLDLGEAFPTMFQILYGIIWELSFFGNPSKRDIEGEDLLEISKSIKDGTAKTVSCEDLFKED